MINAECDTEWFVQHINHHRPRNTSINSCVDHSKSDNLTVISNRGVSVILENVSLVEIKDVRFNPLRNLIAVAAINALVMEVLLKEDSSGGVSVGTNIACVINAAVHAITGVNADIFEKGIVIGMSASKQFSKVNSFRFSLSVKIVFAKDCLP